MGLFRFLLAAPFQRPLLLGGQLGQVAHERHDVPDLLGLVGRRKGGHSARADSIRNDPEELSVWPGLDPRQRQVGSVDLGTGVQAQYHARAFVRERKWGDIRLAGREVNA